MRGHFLPRHQRPHRRGEQSQVKTKLTKGNWPCLVEFALVGMIVVLLSSTQIPRHSVSQD